MPAMGFCQSSLNMLREPVQLAWDTELLNSMAKVGTRFYRISLDRSYPPNYVINSPPPPGVHLTQHRCHVVW
jgi:hypothetical protein